MARRFSPERKAPRPEQGLGGAAWRRLLFLVLHLERLQTDQYHNKADAGSEDPEKRFPLSHRFLLVSPFAPTKVRQGARPHKNKKTDLKISFQVGPFPDRSSANLTLREIVRLGKI